MLFKKIPFLFCLLLLFAVLPDTAPASHIQGQDLTYKCLNACTVRLCLSGYRSCDGINAFSNGIAWAPITPGCAPPTALAPMSQQVIVEVTEVCPGVQTTCTNLSSNISGVEEWFSYQDFDICAVPNCIYTLSWQHCCRNANITSGGSNAGMFTGVTTLNTNITPCNSSPQFSIVPVPYICQGQPYVFNQGATDADGDSLAYALGPCAVGPNQAYPYAPGYSPQQPMGPSWNVSLDPLTGDVTMTPQPGNPEVAVICIYVEEWRNGQLINTIVRDMQVNVIACTNNLPGIAPIANLSGATSTGSYSIQACAGNAISFDLSVTDVDVSDAHIFYWNQNVAGLTFTSGVQVDTVTGISPTATVNWTPTVPGIYTFLVTAKDDACPLPGNTQRTIVINVLGGTPGAALLAAPVGCTNVAFSANTGTAPTGPYTFQWSGDGNLNLNPGNTSAGFTHTFPGPGTYGVSLLLTDANGCSTVLADSVVIPNGPTADAGPDISLCSGNPVTLGSTNLPPGQTYTWSPATGLTNPTSATPTLNYTVSGPNPVTLNYTMTATSGFCTSIDYVTVVVYPTPSASVAGPSNICAGDAATLSASGGASYLWSDSSTTATITVNPSATTTYSVTALANGCASPPVQHTVAVSSGPSVIITGIDSVCLGGSVTLTAAGGSSWLWSTQETTPTITLNNVTAPTTVSVVASDNGCPGPPATFSVALHARPQADYTATAVCLGEEMAFTDRSALSTGSIIAWNWDFGDPASGSQNFSGTQNPIHQFSAPGLYNVELTVTGSNGCTDAFTRQVVVHAPPVAEFEAANVCDGASMVFADQSTANSGIVAWAWDFGTGASSNLPNPNHVFPGPGTYNVVLTVIDGNGCTSSRERTVQVHPNPVSDFFFTQHCFFTEARFFARSSLNDPLGTTLDQYQWDFGDPASGAENTAFGPNPVHVWASGPRTYNVTLTTVTSRGCTHAITLPVTVPVLPSIAVQGDTVCRGFPAELAVLGFPAGTELEWFYTPDATESFLRGETEWVTPPLDLTTVYYVAVRDADGCLSPKTGVIALVRPAPNVTISASHPVVEIPNALVEFHITQVYNGPLTSAVWSFGDGATADATDPVHEYTETGTFAVSLLLTNAFGCQSEQIWPQYVTVDQRVNMFIPNAFSPNGDGVNDVFNVVTRLITDFEIAIYDRWGKLIYQARNQEFGWNGQDGAGDPAPEGAYVYVVQAVDWDGNSVRRSGSVTLLR